MTKYYYSMRYPSYNIANVCQFKDGMFSTDDPDVQRVIETQDWFGVHVFEGIPAIKPRTESEMRIGMRATKHPLINSHPHTHEVVAKSELTEQQAAAEAAVIAKAAEMVRAEKAPSKSEIARATREKLFSIATDMHIPVTGSETARELREKISSSAEGGKE